MSAKTGTDGRPWIELESPKPPCVRDKYEYWTLPPPEPSERLTYWMRQIERGWRPSRRVGGMSYDSSAGWFGVYLWEYLNVIYPALREDPESPS